MKINEFKISDDEMYDEADIDAVIRQEISGEWQYMTATEFLQKLRSMGEKDETKE